MQISPSAPLVMQYCQMRLLSIANRTRSTMGREKIHEPSTDNGPPYRRYHADLFVDEELSCWEKHQMELETAPARTAYRCKRGRAFLDGDKTTVVFLQRIARCLRPFTA